MKPVPSHHLLSAYLDGELSPDEQAGVERLLAESAEARQELQELKQVGELLRQLPQQTLPRHFPAEVLEACLTDTGEFDAETLSGVPMAAAAKSGESPVGDSSRRTRGWLRIAGLCISVAAIGLVIAFLIREPTENPRTEVAANSPEAAEKAEAADAAGSQSPEPQEMAMAPAKEDAAEPFGAASQPQRAQAERKLSDANGQKITRIPQNESLANRLPAEEAISGSAAKPQQSKAGLGGRQENEQVAVVKLLVGDRRRGLQNLQSLLQRHKISRLEAAPAKPGEPVADEAAKDTSLVAVYVETTEGQLADALENLQNQPAFRQVKKERPIAWAQLDRALNPGGQPLAAKRRQRAMSAEGGAGASTPRPAAPALRSARVAELRPSAPAKSKKRRFQMKSAAKRVAGLKAKEAQAAKPEAESAPKEKPKPENAPAPQPDRTPSSFALKKARPVAPQADKIRSDKTEEKQFDEKGRPANSLSRQKPLVLPRAALDQLQSETPESESDQQPPADRSNPSQRSSNKRVKVLFILVDEPPETAPPPPASQPDSGDDNGAA